MYVEYINHSKILANIALAILNGNKDVLDTNGIKEIIALYLMIPYMSDETLSPPDASSFIPKVTGRFSEDISFCDLRNTIAHSFVTVEEDDGNPNSRYGKMLWLDDRAIRNKKEHSKKKYHADAVLVPIDYTHDRLIRAAQEVINAEIPNQAKRD